MKKTKFWLIIFSSLVLILVLIAVFAPVLAPFDPNEAILSEANQAPDDTHIMGTDKMGRDVFSRVIYGTRTSLASTSLLVIMVFSIGGTLGVIAGYAGGKVDVVIMRISDMMVSFPGMALAIAMAGILGPSIINAVIAITMVTWTKYARLSRSFVLKIRNMDYIAASKLSGSTSFTIIRKHLIPAVLPTLIVTAMSDMGGMMLELAGFSFLGLGANATSIEWGYMLNEGREVMTFAPWLMIYPGLAIFITVMVFNLLGDNVRDILDPKNHSIKQSMKASIKFVVIALGGSLIVSTLIVGNSGKDAIAPNSENLHLDFGCYKYSDSIDPSVNVNSSWCGVRYGITECLFKFDENVVAQPNLVDEITHSEDYKIWTLHILEGLQFSNGNAVTPSAVVASIERLYRETDAEQGGEGNSNPEGYLVYDSITANDEEGTVTIVCEQPTANLEGILAYPYFAIVDTSVADTQIVGTGPYKEEYHNVGINLEMSKNEYYRKDVPYDTVNIIYIEDNATKAMALQSGDVDLVENITSADALAQLTKLPDDYYISTAAGVRTGNSYINFHSELSNDTLRKAVIMALDDQTMCEVTVGGMYTEGFSVLPSSLSYNYQKLTDPYAFDKEEAEKMLNEAGIIDTNGDGFRELDGENIDLNYVAYTSRNLNDFAQAVSLQLAEIGIKTTVSIRDYDTALALQNAGEFDLMTTNTITVGIGDPQDYLGNWYSPNAVNYGYYYNEEYDMMYEQLIVEQDDENRIELITKLQQILIDDAATIVHGYYNSRMFSRTDEVSKAEIETIDYYWLTTDILPADM